MRHPRLWSPNCSRFHSSQRHPVESSAFNSNRVDAVNAGTSHQQTPSKSLYTGQTIRSATASSSTLRHGRSVFISFSFEFSYSQAPSEVSVSRVLHAPSPARQKPLAVPVFIVQNGRARPSSHAACHPTKMGSDWPVKSLVGSLPAIPNE